MNKFEKIYKLLKVMDTIEDYVRENGDSFDAVVDYEEFSLKD